MIFGQLARLAVAVQVGARIADVPQVDSPAREQQHGQRGPHPRQLGVRQRRFVDIAVGLDDGTPEQAAHWHAFVIGAGRHGGAGDRGRPGAQRLLQLALDDLDRHAARALAAEVSAHSVGDGVQAQAVIAQEAVLVVVALAADVRRPPPDNSHCAAGSASGAGPPPPSLGPRAGADFEFAFAPLPAGAAAAASMMKSTRAPPPLSTPSAVKRAASIPFFTRVSFTRSARCCISSLDIPTEWTSMRTFLSSGWPLRINATSPRLWTPASRSSERPPFIEKPSRSSSSMRSLVRRTSGAPASGQPSSS